MFTRKSLGSLFIRRQRRMRCFLKNNENFPTYHISSNLLLSFQFSLALSFTLSSKTLGAFSWAKTTRALLQLKRGEQMSRLISVFSLFFRSLLHCKQRECIHQCTFVLKGSEKKEETIKKFIL